MKSSLIEIVALIVFVIGFLFFISSIFTKVMYFAIIAIIFVIVANFVLYSIKDKK